MSLNQLILIVAFVLPMALAALLFLSRHNFLFFTELPRLIIAYVLGVVFLYSEGLFEHQVSPLVIDSMSYAATFALPFICLGVFVGYFSSATRKLCSLTFRCRAPTFWERANQYINMLALMGISLVILGFYLFDYIPLLADNPIAAKYGANEYVDAYKRGVVPYRLGLFLLIFITPFLIFNVYLRFSFVSATLLFLVVVLAVLSMRRGSFGFPILFSMFAIFAVYKKGVFLPFYILLFVGLFFFAASLHAILMIYLGRFDAVTIKTLVYGMPDVKDLIWFYSAFERRELDYALGRTIYGGLIPNHYTYNPGVFTKLVIGGTSYEASGGFRLPHFTWGYVNFSYIGSVFYGLVQGITIGFLVYWSKMLKKYRSNKPVYFLSFAILVTFYKFILSLPHLRIELVLSVFAIFMLFLVTKISIRGRGLVQ